MTLNERIAEKIMNKRPAYLFAAIGSVILMLGFAAAAIHFQDKCATLESQNALLTKEVRGKAYELRRIKDIRPELDEARFMLEVFRGRDRMAYRASKAAWKWGRHYNISPYLVVAVIHRESNFDPRAVSSVGAVGLMQVMPRVWNLSPEKLAEIDYNVEHGTRILRHYIDKHGSQDKALFHYWGGDNERHGYGYPANVLGSRFYNHGG